MEEFKTDWTKDEFKAYLLMHAAEADYVKTDEERALIRTVVTNESYSKIYKELQGDNDYQRIQKILFNLEKFDYSKDDLKAIVKDLKQLFHADGEIDLLEENMLYSLKQLFKTVE